MSNQSKPDSSSGSEITPAEPSPRVPVLKPLLLDLPETLETPRLVLRPPRPGDGPLVNAAILESLPELKPWMPWADPAPTVEQSEEFARRSHAAFLARKELNWRFLLKETGELAGIGGIHTIDWTVPRGEIGYWACTRFAGRGLVREAVEALTRLGFDTLGLVRIEIRCDRRNERSAGVARSAGYSLEGVLRLQARGVDGELRDTLLFARVVGQGPVADPLVSAVEEASAPAELPRPASRGRSRRKVPRSP
jgi:ribosomal-protein-serine acetyltransferase